MKLLLGFILITTSLMAKAEVPAPDFQCVTGMPTTSFFVQNKADKVHFTIVNHNGNKYAPFWDRIVVPQDLPILSKYAETISKLGTVFELDFDKKGCNFGDHQNFECHGTGHNITSNGLTVEPWAIYTTDVTSKTLDQTFQHKNVTFMFYVNGESYTLTNNYDVEECNNL
jgi:hypothetical protein